MGKASKTKAQVSEKKQQSVKTEESSSHATTRAPVSKEIIAEHLPPIGLVFSVIACSGFLFVYSFRDVFATGKIVGGSMDAAMQVRLLHMPILHCHLILAY